MSVAYAQRHCFPKEMTKLGDPLLETRGNYVILCLSDDNDAARAIIDEAAGA